MFGRNALRAYKIEEDVLKKHLARDKLARERLAYAERADPSFLTYGPKTRREFLSLKARGGESDGSTRRTVSCWWPR